MAERESQTQSSSVGVAVSCIRTDMSFKFLAINHAIAVPVEIVKVVEIPRRPSAGTG